jgi:hypothetical protein
MKCGAQVALAVAGGYVLGRRKKTKLAMMLGGAALTGGLNAVTGKLLQSGTKVLGSSDVLGKAGKAAPGLGEVGDMIKGDLTSVVKRAAATAVSAQIDSLSEQLRNRADAIREESTGRAGGRAGRAAQTDETEPIDEDEPEDEPEDDIDEEPAPRRRNSAGRQRDAHADDDEEPAEARPRVGARAGRTARAPSSSAPSSPIRRTQR